MTALRVAFTGKGGAGKSVLVGTLARLLARQGRRVLVVDSDPMPGVAFSLGMASVDAALPDELVDEATEGDGPRFRLRVAPEDAVEQFAQRGPDGVRLLQFGKLHGHVGTIVRSQHAFRQIVDGLPHDGWDLVGDLPGGTRQAFFGWGRFAGVVVVVVEPTAPSVRTARRLARVAEPGLDVVAVANKVRQPGDVAMVQGALALPVVATVPTSPDVAAAEQRGLAVVDTAPGSPAVMAVESLARWLCAQPAAEEVGR